MCTRTRFSGRPGRCVPWALAAVVLFVLPAAADELAAPVRDAEALLGNAYGKTKSAKTREEFDAILQLCQQAKATQPEQALLDYANELTAWTHNQLGELYAEQAAALAGEERKAEAEAIDAQALAEFEAAVEADPDYWKGRHNRGVSLALRGKFNEAVADFGRVVELKPDYANAWFNRGELYFDQAQYEEALSDYTQAIRLRPDDYDAHFRRGHAYFHLRRFREALADYDRAAQLKPQEVEAIVNRGDAQWNLGQWREAAEDYQKAISLDNRSGRAYRSAAWLMATCPEDKYRQKELAVQAAERAVELDGDEDFAYLDTLAAAYANAGEFDQAQQTIAQAIKLAPGEQKQTLQRRLELYTAEKPYREKTD
jgi:tetratricopeptide (TPR) repeat protein